MEKCSPAVYNIDGGFLAAAGPAWVSECVCARDDVISLDMQYHTLEPTRSNSHSKYTFSCITT